MRACIARFRRETSRAIVRSNMSASFALLFSRPLARIRNPLAASSLSFSFSLSLTARALRLSTCACSPRIPLVLLFPPCSSSTVCCVLADIGDGSGVQLLVSGARDRAAASRDCRCCRAARAARPSALARIRPPSLAVAQHSNVTGLARSSLSSSLVPGNSAGFARTIRRACRSRV